MREQLEQTRQLDQSQSWRLPFLPADSREFRELLAQLHYSETTYYPVGFSKQPKDFFLAGFDPDAVDIKQASLASRWILPRPGTLNENLADNRKELKIGMAFHGFACSHKKIATGQTNYFERLTAALGYPMFAVDWTGYNALPKDAQQLEKHHWMTQIDHYPYVMLQLVQNLQQELPKLAPLLTTLDKSIPLHIHLIGHSVAGRSLLVAASLDGPVTLAALQNKWSQELQRPVFFKVSALQPAFGLPPDVKMDSLWFFDWSALKPFMKHTPSAVLGILQLILNKLTPAYGLSDGYPFLSMLQEDLSLLVSHPGAIRRKPQTTVRQPKDMTNLSVAVILAGNDRFVDNRRTQEVLTGSAKNPGWMEYCAQVTETELTIERTQSFTRGGMQVATIDDATHVPEIQIPDAVARLIEFLHR